MHGPKALSPEWITGSTQGQGWWQWFRMVRWRSTETTEVPSEDWLGGKIWLWVSSFHLLLPIWPTWFSVLPGNSVSYLISPNIFLLKISTYNFCCMPPRTPVRPWSYQWVFSPILMSWVLLLHPTHSMAALLFTSWFFSLKSSRAGITVFFYFLTHYFRPQHNS